VQRCRVKHRAQDMTEFRRRFGGRGDARLRHSGAYYKDEVVLWERRRGSIGVHKFGKSDLQSEATGGLLGRNLQDGPVSRINRATA